MEDDNHYPAWKSGGNAWEYDKPEIYFDVNDTLVDGLGPATPNSGHYQFSPGFVQDGYGEMHEAAGTTQTPGGQYAYVLTGESYVYESAINTCSMNKKDGVAMIDRNNGINEINTASFVVHPNPVSDLLTINADFDKVVINNILGQEIRSINQIRTNKLDVGYLSKGVYIMKVYKGERYIGAARIMKN